MTKKIEKKVENKPVKEWLRVTPSKVSLTMPVSIKLAYDVVTRVHGSHIAKTYELEAEGWTENTLVFDSLKSANAFLAELVMLGNKHMKLRKKGKK